jgi:hypothetical protein
VLLRRKKYSARKGYPSEGLHKLSPSLPAIECNEMASLMTQLSSLKCNFGLEEKKIAASPLKVVKTFLPFIFR